MKRLFAFLVIFALSFSAPDLGQTPELSPGDREKLREAENTADRFVERFRQTLDFKTVWNEFHLSDPSCTYKTNGFFSENDYKRLKFDPALIERLYLSWMNHYFLSNAYYLTLVRMESKNLEIDLERKTPEELQAGLERSKTVVERKPQNASEVVELIAELNRLDEVYRRHMPRDAMRSAVWRANVKYFISRTGVTHLAVGTGHPDFCIPSTTKYYVVDRGLFYFYLVEEDGVMRVAGFGIGN